MDSLKRHNKEWSKVQEDLAIDGFSRTIDNLKSLFNKNRFYLSLPHASSDDFIAIMNDYYNTELESSPEKTKPAA